MAILTHQLGSVQRSLAQQVAQQILMKIAVVQERENIPRAHRLCRFDCGEVETPDHALFLCTGTPALVERRRQLSSTRGLPSSFRTVSVQTETALFKSLVFNRDMVCQMAKGADGLAGCDLRPGTFRKGT
ncbi:hypothetical protein B0H17DRAFT_1130605 [Mycena rosella]|uniref:Uncharacterized protein n=1 Tax=Mycena rosella TaxID=1033263 RepID=A0AAD7DQG1_MYCRO|nr:hypothetical protein B0H17DRAFT_1130605 [Mycena rosella]